MPIAAAAAFVVLATVLSWIPWWVVVITVGDPTATTAATAWLAVFAHAALNTWYGAAVQFLAPDAAADFMPDAAILLTAAAVALVWRHGPRELSREPRHLLAAR